MLLPPYLWEAELKVLRIVTSVNSGRKVVLLVYEPASVFVDIKLGVVYILNLTKCLRYKV